MIDNRRNIEFWDEAARRTGAENVAFAGMLMDGREFEAIYRCRAEQDRFLTLFTPAAESRVLEVGSGGGRWGFFLADKVGEYIGLDISPAMVAAASAESARRGLRNVRFECRNMLEFEARRQFDVVYFSGVLQYMDDDVVARCLVKAAELMTPRGCIISRDSVQKVQRVERTGEYPVVYRTADEYRSLFEGCGFRLTYSDVSYPHKRFTRLASHIYRVPGMTYSVAYALRESLCFVDRVLGCPDYLKTAKHRAECCERNPQEHRFFKYVPLEANE